MVIEQLEARHIQRIAKRALIEAGLPSEGMPRVFVASTLSLHVGATISTRMNGSYELFIDETSNPNAGKALDRLDYLTVMLTENMLRGLAADNYPAVYHSNGTFSTLKLGAEIASMS